jgi:predicted carbohydrate-binding protein with CBM5 and CBM33 domain
MRLLAAAAVLSLLAATTDAHGFVSQPRMRGALKCQRNVVPQVMDASAPIDYCPHCLNAGGVGRVSAAGPWAPYEPMKGNKRGGFGICGDPAGSDDHMKTGKFANPPSMPFVADYTAGGVANFEFDATANHGGYLEFYLCNVEKNPNQEIQFSTFAQDCHYLERVAHDSCESGNDKDCGPIDPEFPGRWGECCLSFDSIFYFPPIRSATWC